MSMREISAGPKVATSRLSAQPEQEVKPRRRAVSSRKMASSSGQEWGPASETGGHKEESRKTRCREKRLAFQPKFERSSQMSGERKRRRRRTVLRTGWSMFAYRAAERKRVELRAVLAWALAALLSCGASECSSATTTSCSPLDTRPFPLGSDWTSPEAHLGAQVASLPAANWPTEEPPEVGRAAHSSQQKKGESGRQFGAFLLRLELN